MKITLKKWNPNVDNYLQLGTKRIEIPVELENAVLRIHNEKNITAQRSIFLLRKECLRVSRQVIFKKLENHVCPDTMISR